MLCSFVYQMKAMDRNKYIFIVFVVFASVLNGLSRGTVRLTPNIAKNGNATKSFVHRWGGHPASNANDGNLDTNVNTCALTGPSAPSWWQVDLLDVYEINKVALTVASMAYGNVKGFYIDVGNNSDGSSADHCAYEPNGFNAGETRVYTCPCGIFGQYVRMRYPLDVENQIEICEVQVQPRGSMNFEFCNEPKDLDNAVRSVPNTEYKPGATIRYTCDKCYTGGGISTCQQCNGEWSLVPQCKVHNCIDLGAIQNGQVEGSPPFTCLSTLNYTCSDGYWLLGAGTLRCGIDGRWDNNKPVCIDKSQGCGEPPMIPNSLRFGSVTEVMYQCDECYTGGGSATCRNGQWDFEATCEMTICDDFPDVPNGKRNSNESNVMCGAKVAYTCNDGFTLVGNSELECITGGILHGQVPICNNSDTLVAGDEADSDQNEEDDNDVLVLGLAVTGALLGGIIITLAAVYLILKRRSPKIIRKTSAEDNKTSLNYETPNASETVTKPEEDGNDEYMELEDPYFAGYMKPVPN